MNWSGVNLRRNVTGRMGMNAMHMMTPQLSNGVQPLSSPTIYCITAVNWRGGGGGGKGEGEVNE